MSKQRRSSERGAAAVVMSVLLAGGLLLGMGALAVDLGQMYETRREAQTAADLAATAGGPLIQYDPLKACQEAVRYLLKDNPKNEDIQGFPQVSDCTPSGTPGGQVDGDGDGAAESAVVTVTSDSIRVVVPPQRVTFGFAAALGIANSKVSAGATVALRTFGGGIGPFAIPAGCLTSTSQWYFSIKEGPSGQDSGTSSCTDPQTGSFGWLDLMRDGSDNSGDLGDDVRNGADHRVGFVPGVDPNLLPYASSTAPDCNGIITSSGGDVTYDPRKDKDGPYSEPALPNCVGVKKGNVSSIVDDIVGKQNGQGSCEGRLNNLSGPSGNKSRTFGNCPINGYTLSDYVSQGFSLAQVKSGTLGSLRAEIVDNPNFFVVPIVFSTGRPKAQDTPVVGYRGLFLDCPEGAPSPCSPFGDATGPNQLKEIDGFVFKLSTIAISTNHGNVDAYYTGGGLAVPVLVRDPLN